MWFIFAPSSPGASLPGPAASWSPVSATRAPYFELSSVAIPRLTQDIRPRRQEFWKRHVPEVTDAVDRALEEKEADAQAEPEPEAEPSPYFIATWILLALLLLVIIALVVLAVIFVKTRRDSYNMDREGTVKYVAK